MKNMFEVHFSLEALVGVSVNWQVVAWQFIRLGFDKVKRFGLVYDYQRTEEHNVPSTGHDLSHPVLMVTTKTSSLEHAVGLIRMGKSLANSNGLKSRFELEVPRSLGSPGLVVQVRTALSEFSLVPDSPEQESHLVIRGLKKELPTIEEIGVIYNKVFGYLPHQVVDFERLSGNEDTPISRVVTLYQESLTACDEFEAKLNVLREHISFDYCISEQVCMVGD